MKKKMITRWGAATDAVGGYCSEVVGGAALQLSHNVGRGETGLLADMGVAVTAKIWWDDSEIYFHSQSSHSLNIFLKLIIYHYHQLLCI